jgi:hypothetical protein
MEILINKEDDKNQDIRLPLLSNIHKENKVQDLILDNSLETENS